MKKTKMTAPTHLEVGMRVKAICMSKLVGDYVVISIGGDFAYLAIHGDPPTEKRESSVVVGRKINPSNNSVKVLRGQKVQCADYYVVNTEPHTTTTKSKKKYTPENIQHLRTGEIFVFGSNVQGQHIGGAARVAYKKFGARWGVSEGLMGQSYAIPTLDLETGTEVPIPTLEEEFIRLLTTAQSLPEYTFWVTKVGCGIARRSVREVRDAFWRAARLVSPLAANVVPDNVILPREFWNETPSKETPQQELNSLLCTRKKLFNQGRKYTSLQDKERHAGVVLDIDAAIHCLEDEIKNAE